MDKNSTFLKIFNWLFGGVFFAIGLLNTFWGNDLLFGIFILLLSLVYFLPVDILARRISGIAIPGMRVIKIVLGIFILWASLGVGELFSKIDLMLTDFRRANFSQSISGIRPGTRQAVTSRQDYICENYGNQQTPASFNLRLVSAVPALLQR